MDKHGYRSALKHRDFRLLITSFTITSTGGWAYNLALWIYVYDRTHSFGWVAATTMVRFIPSLLFSAYAGVLADRFERVRLLVRVRVLLVLGMGLMALTAALNAPVPLVLVFAVLCTLTGMVNDPAERALTPQIVGEEDLAAANALTGAVENLVVITGPAIGAGLLLLGPPPLVFAMTAATHAIGVLLTMQVRARSNPVDVTDGGNAGPFRQMVVGIRTMASSSLVVLLVGFCVLASFVYGTDTVLFIAISRDLLGTGSDGTGYLLAGLGVGGVLAAFLVNRFAASPRLGAVITVGMAVYCLPTALLVLVHSPALAFGLQAVRGTGTLVVDVLAVTALQRSLPQDRIARVFGAFTGLVLLAISLGAFVTPLLLHGLGLRNTMLVYGLGIPAAVAISYVVRLAAMDKAAVAQVAELAPKVALLQSLGIFAKASRPALERLAGGLTELTVPDGEAVVREGEVADALYVLLDGQVTVTARGEAGIEQQLRTMEPGSYFGEIGLLEHIPRTATVTATGPCRLYRIDGEAFIEALTSLSASTSLLEGAKTRLAASHPSYVPSATVAMAPPPTQPAA